ncbi:MAG: hypothetical protein HFH84_03090 [Lachnospiraceae bacterium]|mgnify:CR=1 FL=1|nr:hypothetical protein [Lachnospiraceae bacterium]
MFAFFDGVVQFLSTVIDFIINFFSGLLHFFVMLTSSLTFLAAVVAYLPVFLQVFVLAVIGMSIVYQIINHGG